MSTHGLGAMTLTRKTVGQLSVTPKAMGQKRLTKLKWQWVGHVVRDTETENDTFETTRKQNKRRETANEVDR